MPTLRSTANPTLLLPERRMDARGVRRSALLLVGSFVSLALWSGCAASGSVPSSASVADGGSATSVVTSSPRSTTPSDPLPVSSLPAEDVPVEDSPAVNTPAETTTSSTVPAVSSTEAHDPSCVVRVVAGDSLDAIAARFDVEWLSGAAIAAENGLDGETIYPGQMLDVCADNGVNDISGETIADRNAAIRSAEVVRQQEHLNVLFAGLGLDPLLVDGISGPVTRQRLCAARLAFGLPVSTADMVAGSDEEQILFAASELPVPFTSAILSPRWVLIDRTCQVMFAGEGTECLVFVFPTSTGAAGFETRDQDLKAVVRFNPALDNGGWHNSSSYPVAEDNPLNGNMYKPLYFDGGQAIHGANSVPTSPASKGCARLRVAHQDMLLYWLGLGAPTSSARTINLTVNVQGVFVPS